MAGWKAGAPARWLCVALAALLLVVTWPGSQPGMAAGDTQAARVDCAFRVLDVRGKVGQAVMVAIDGSKPSPATADFLRYWRPGGIILFGRNIDTVDNLKALLVSAQRTARLPLLVATDQEGGPVVRIHVGLTPLAAQAEYGRMGSAARVYSDTYAQGLALKALGVNMNLAPVIDVRVNTNSAIGNRSFGPNPVLDATLAAAAVRGYQAAGIAATAKHFIGLGEVRANADLSLPIVKATRAQLEDRDMPPMRAAIAAGVDAMMVTRVQIPALDPSGTTAYASPVMIQNIIRGELGYSGLLITDSLVTPAIFAGPGPNTAAIAGLSAGDDLLLLGSGVRIPYARLGRVIAAVIEAVEHGGVAMSRLDDAVQHVLKLKVALGLLPPCRI